MRIGCTLKSFLLAFTILLGILLMIVGIFGIFFMAEMVKENVKKVGGIFLQ
jgi:hypothetical protein